MDFAHVYEQADRHAQMHADAARRTNAMLERFAFAAEKQSAALLRLAEALERSPFFGRPPLQTVGLMTPARSTDEQAQCQKNPRSRDEEYAAKAACAGSYDIAVEAVSKYQDRSAPAGAPLRPYPGY